MLKRDEGKLFYYTTILPFYYSTILLFYYITTRRTPLPPPHRRRSRSSATRASSCHTLRIYCHSTILLFYSSTILLGTKQPLPSHPQAVLSLHRDEEKRLTRRGDMYQNRRELAEQVTGVLKIQTNVVPYGHKGTNIANTLCILPYRTRTCASWASRCVLAVWFIIKRHHTTPAASLQPLHNLPTTSPQPVPRTRTGAS